LITPARREVQPGAPGVGAWHAASAPRRAGSRAAGDDTSGKLQYVGHFPNLTAFRNSSITAAQCVAINGNAIDASVLIFPLVEAGPSIAQLAAFASGDCSGAELGTIPMNPGVTAVSAWITNQAPSALVPGGTRSVRF
jgi:hypothetical protein